MSIVARNLQAQVMDISRALSPAESARSIDACSEGFPAMNVGLSETNYRRATISTIGHMFGLITSIVAAVIPTTDAG